MGNQNVRDLLARSAFELAAVRPHHVSTICESLVKAIARGRNDNVPVVIGDRSFANRAEAKGEARRLVTSGQEEDFLHVTDKEDVAFLTALIAHHPRGEAKARGLKGFGVGKHPKIGCACLFVIREDGKEDFFTCDA